MNERGTFPSGSALPRIFACPGSLHAAEALGKADLTPEAGDVAAEGEWLHEVIMGTKPEVGLSDEQEWAVQEARSLRDEAIVVTDTLGESLEYEYFSEQRLWVHGKNLKILYSGKFDELYVVPDQNIALIVDYKMGRIPVDPAPANIQLMGYAVAVWQNCDQFGLDPSKVKINAAIIQPRIDWGRRMSLTCWHPALLEAGYREIQNKLLLSPQDAPRVPSISACRYCPYVTCPDAWNHFLNINLPSDE